MNARHKVTRVSANVIEPEVPALRRIKIGGRKQKRGRGFLPEKWDHFKVTFAAREQQEPKNFVIDEAFHQAIGDPKPKELDVRLLWDEVEKNFETKLMAYRGRDLVCVGNGERAWDRDLEEEIPCTCPLLASHDGKYEGPKRDMEKATCKPYGALKVLLEAQKTFGGVALFDTTSYHTIRGILGQLEDYRDRFGFLAGLPLKMVLVPDTASPKGENATYTIYKVALVLRADFDTALQLAAAARERREQYALPAGEQLVQIEERVAEAQEENLEGIAEEYYPPTAPAEAPEFADDDRPAEDEQLLEDMIRLALETMEWSQKRINRQIAKYSADLTELEAILEREAPKEMEFARSELARAEEAPETEGAEEDEDEAVDAELAANGDTPDVQEAEYEIEDEPASEEAETADAGAEQENLF